MSTHARSPIFVHSNLGKIDCCARLLLASAMLGFVLLAFDEENALSQYWLTTALFAVPLAISAIIRWDPFYALLRLRTTDSDRWLEYGSTTPDLVPNLSVTRRVVRLLASSLLIGIGMSYPAVMTWQPYVILAAIPLAMTAIIGLAPIEAMFKFDDGKLPQEKQFTRHSTLTPAH